MDLVIPKLFKILKRIKLMGGGRRGDEVEKNKRSSALLDLENHHFCEDRQKDISAPLLFNAQRSNLQVHYRLRNDFTCFPVEDVE